MVGFDAVLRAMDIALQLRVAKVIERVDAADQLVEFEDRLVGSGCAGAGRTACGSACLAHFLEPKRGDDPIDIGFLSTIIARSIWPAGCSRHVLVLRDVVAAVQVPQLSLETGESWRELQPEPVHDAEIRLVDAVHVAGDHGRHDVRGIVVADVENVVALVLMGADQFRLERHMVGEQRVGDDALAGAEVLARVSRFGRRIGRREFLAVDAAVQDLGIERVEREDAEAGDEVADPVIGGFAGSTGAGAADGSPPGRGTECRWFRPC